MKIALLDTGPLVGYLDASDEEHALIVEVLERFSGVLYTTGAVITETMHFIGADSRGPSALMAFLEESRINIHDCFGYSNLREAVLLMDQYRNVPMDFADATLVLLSERLHCADIFTLDRRGFKTFCTPTKKSFRLMLDNV